MAGGVEGVGKGDAHVICYFTSENSTMADGNPVRPPATRGISRTI